MLAQYVQSYVTINASVCLRCVRFVSYHRSRVGVSIRVACHCRARAATFTALAALGLQVSVPAGHFWCVAG